ncbi:MAG: PAS domain S-box protein [Spirochaetaceae bacterium]
MNLEIKKSTNSNIIQGYPLETVKKLEIGIENSPVSIIITDKNGLIEYVNRKFCTITEYCKEEVIGKNPNILKSDYHDDEFYKYMWKLIKSGKEWKGIIKNRKKRGDLFWEEANITPIFGSDNIISNYICTKHDISLEVKQEQEIKTLKEVLKHKNKIDAVGQLAGVIAHDFNNILSGIINLAELLKIGTDSFNQKEIDYIDLILQSADDATNLTQILESLNNRLDIKLKELDISEFLDNFMDSLRYTLEDKYHIEYINKYSSIFINGNCSELLTSLSNIIENATSSMKNGGEITIELDLIELDKKECLNFINSVSPGRYCSISISDNGHGISLEKMQNIFNPFFKINSNKKLSGLGLYTVNGCLKDHNGAVNIKSILDKGTTVTLYFPITDNSGNTKIAPPNYLCKTILLVDDEKINRITGKDLLEHIGFKVLLASDGDEAVKIYSKKHLSIDLVLIDMVMPKMNGFDAFNAMKNIDHKCKGIILSGYLDYVKIQDLIDSGILAILSKPYSINELEQVINENI